MLKRLCGQDGIDSRIFHRHSRARCEPQINTDSLRRSHIGADIFCNARTEELAIRLSPASKIKHGPTCPV